MGMKMPQCTVPPDTDNEAIARRGTDALRLVQDIGDAVVDLGHLGSGLTPNWSIRSMGLRFPQPVAR